MRKSTRKNWMAKEKIAILNCINEGLKVKAIKRKLFPGDRNIKYNALAKVIERIKNNNQWAYEEPRIIFKYKNSSHETKVEKQNPHQRKSPLHFWPVTEKKKVAEAAFVKKWSVKTIKEVYYQNDETVSAQSIYALIYRMKKDPSWVNHHPTTNTPGNPNFNREKSKIRFVTAEVHPVSKDNFELDSVYEQFSGYKKSVNEFVNTINSLIDESCPFTKEQQEEIRNFIKAKGVLAIKSKQPELINRTAILMY